MTFEDQNLWIIDEKLSYHHYLASDIPIKSIKVADNNDNQRPDLIIFDPAFVLSEGEDQINSVVIVEFKRPGTSGRF